MVSLFKYIDSENKGSIGLSQLERVFKREANIISPQEVVELWKQLNKGEESAMTMDEYLELFN